VNMGAKVLNNSWAGGPFSGILQGVIKYANRQNALFVAAAGNSTGGSDNDINPVYPANYAVDNVIAVAATNATDHLWADSHWGKHTVHITAPGHNIVSTFPVSQVPQGILLADGTSMAAPHVAGCAALVQALREAKSLPPLIPKDLKDLLMKTGHPVPGLVAKIILGRRLDCLEALLIVQTGLSPPLGPTNLPTN